MSTSLQTTGLLVAPQAHGSHCCSGLRICCSLSLQCSSLKSSHGRLVPMPLLSAQVLPTPASSYLNMLSEHIHRHTHQLLTGLLSSKHRSQDDSCYLFTVCIFLLKRELRGMVTLFFFCCLFVFIHCRTTNAKTVLHAQQAFNLPRTNTSRCARKNKVKNQ